MFVTQQAMNQHKGKVPLCPVFFSLFSKAFLKKYFAC